MVAPCSSNAPRRVRFGHTLVIEVLLEHENPLNVHDGNACTSPTRRKEALEASVLVGRCCHKAERSKDPKTGTSGLTTDESNEDDVGSLIDAFVRFDSARTKSRSLHPRLEKSVELDFMKSAMWTRRMTRSD
eukprot:TRINITY_DN15720_c1_g1_i1.p2 TRINITY_DN15720_c1_g1~~TRINITY_DN15720_c1_g1_i1.p2  ORF type:complete len:132 (+),score=13.02 TRINITY_DN15720_c1_g1_i1:69-464(+)